MAKGRRRRGNQQRKGRGRLSAGAGSTRGAAPNAGHATHFLERLEQRLGGEAEELALELYHRPAALRAMMPRLTLPEKTERVALALAPGEQGPWVIVTREGSFVTCLARGMSPGDGYPVSYERLLAHRDRFLETRERIDSAGKLAPDSAYPFQTLLERALLGPISREEFRALEPTMALLGRELFQQLIADLQRAKQLYERLDRRPVDRRRDDRRLRELWTIHHRSCNILLLLSGSHFTPTLSLMADAVPTLFEMFEFLARPREVGLLLRLAHFIGRHGKLALACCKKLLQDPRVPSQLLVGICGLVAIGARTSKTRGELRKLWARLPQQIKGWSPAVGGLLRELFRDNALEVYMLTSVTPEAVLSTLPQSLSAWFEKHVEELEQSGELAAQLHVERGEEVDRSAAFAVFSWPERVAPPVGDDVDDDDTQLERARNVWGMLNLLLPQAVTGDASDFFLPHKHLPPPERRHLAAARRQVDVAIELASAVAGQISHQRAEKAPRVGRNDPCPCGSGVKHKRCCMGNDRDIEFERESVRAVVAERSATVATIGERYGFSMRDDTGRRHAGRAKP
jgi:hypothetical protein